MCTKIYTHICCYAPIDDPLEVGDLDVPQRHHEPGRLGQFDQRVDGGHDEGAGLVVRGHAVEAKLPVRDVEFEVLSLRVRLGLVRVNPHTENYRNRAVWFWAELCACEIVCVCVVVVVVRGHTVEAKLPVGNVELEVLGLSDRNR